MAWEPVSRAVVGSSSSQIGRLMVTKRCDRKPATLAGRQIAGRQVDDGPEPNGGKRLVNRRGTCAEHPHPEVEVFSNRKGRLEGILVAR